MINFTSQHKINASVCCRNGTDGHLLNTQSVSNISNVSHLIVLALLDGAEATFSNLIFDADCKAFLSVLQCGGANVTFTEKKLQNCSVVDVFLSKSRLKPLISNSSENCFLFDSLFAVFALCLTVAGNHCFYAKNLEQNTIFAMESMAKICRQKVHFDGEKVVVQSNGILPKKPCFKCFGVSQISLAQAVLCIGACGGGSIIDDCFEQIFPEFLQAVGVQPLRLALLGSDIANSKSPLLMMNLSRNANVCCSYHLCPLPKDASDQMLLQTLLNFDGANITMPFKNRVAKLLGAELSSVNTVGKNIFPTSTDGYGIVQSLKNHGLDIQGKSVWIVGAGGAAEACICELKKHNVTMQVVNRTREKAEELSAKYCLCARIEEPCGVLSFVPQCEFEQQLQLPNSVQFVLVAAYRGKSGIAEQAKQRNIECVNGLEMLYHQGAKSFALWSGGEIQNNYESFKEMFYENTFA